jgi:hypothetical protein
MVQYLTDAEKRIAMAVIEDALADGLKVSVYDGEAYPLRMSTDVHAILAEIGPTDETTLVFYDPLLKEPDGKRPLKVGGVLMITGEGDDLLCNWSDNERVNAVVARGLSLSGGPR